MISLFLTDRSILDSHECIGQTEFSSQAASVDAAVFRKLLKSIAVLQNGRWNLK